MRTRLLWKSTAALAAATAAFLLATSAFAGGILPTDRHDRPFPMGISIGNTESSPFIYAGTAGMLVRPFSNPSVRLILSNNHVLGAVGPTLCPNTATPGLRTLQPGTLDIGFDPGADPFYLAGVFVGAIPINFSGGGNLVDAALAFTTDTLTRTEIFEIGEPNPELRFPALGMNVTKSGRTTGVTTGVIDAVNISSNVNYGASCGTAFFTNQFSVVTGAFSDSGDSGSVILDGTDNTPVGLLFAGSALSTIGNPIPFVYLSLGVFPVVPGAGPSRQQAVAEAEAQMQDTPAMARMKAIQRRAEADLFSIPGVVGVGIGQADDGEGLALVIYVDAPSAEARSALPSVVDGAPVRVIDGGPFEAR